MIKDRDQYKRLARNQLYDQHHTHDEPTLGEVIDSRKIEYLGQPEQRKLDFGHPTFNLLVVSFVTGSCLGTLNSFFNIQLNNSPMNQLETYKLYRFGQKNPWNYLKYCQKHFLPGFLIGFIATPFYFGYHEFLKNYFSDQRVIARDILAIATVVTGAWFLVKGQRNIGKAFLAGCYIGGLKFCLPSGANYGDQYRSTAGTNIRRGFYEQHPIEEEKRLMFQRRDAIYELQMNENIKCGFRVDL